MSKSAEKIGPVEKDEAQQTLSLMSLDALSTEFAFDLDLLKYEGFDPKHQKKIIFTCELGLVVNRRVFEELVKWVATWKITGLGWVPGPGGSHGSHR
jgi:hypothetical protein